MIAWPANCCSTFEYNLYIAGSNSSRFVRAAGASQDVQRTPDVCCQDILNGENAQETTAIPRKT